MNHRQGRFLVKQVGAQGLSDGVCFAGYVQQVVNDLKRNTNVQTVFSEAFNLFSASVGQQCSDAACTGS